MSEHPKSGAMNRFYRWVASLIAAGVLVACGGGGGGDLAGVGTGGTGTVSSAVTVGSISGFGSVIVAGVRFDDTGASVADEDGNTRSRADLRLGMVTTISGTADFVAGTGRASQIVYGSEIVGPVNGIDLARGTFTVLGATVSVKPTTVFDERLNGLAALRTGDLVEVYGAYNAATGAYTATRIEPRSSVSRYRLRGPVSGLDGARRRFVLAGVVIDYQAVPAAQLSGLAEGQILRVSSSRGPAGGVWSVDSVSGARRAALADGEAKVEGSLSQLLSPTSFVVDGVTVDAARARIKGSLVQGVRVEVEGTVRNGVLIADEVDTSDEDASSTEAFEITAVIEAFDPATQRFTLRGQAVDASATVIFEGGSRSNLANGRKIELKGWFDASRSVVVATRIHFED